MDELRYSEWLKVDDCSSIGCYDCEFDEDCAEYGITRHARKILKERLIKESGSK